MESGGTPEPGGETKSCGGLPVPAERRRHIFLSYGHDETAPAAERIAPLPERIKRDLEARGHEVWFDSDRLIPGDSWMPDIEKGLNDAAEDLTRGRFVLLMTPHSLRPDGFCLNELAFALDLKLRVLPVLVTQCRPPICIYATQYLKMVDCVPCQEKQQQYQELFQKLAEALELSTGENPKFDNLESELMNNLLLLDYRGDIKFHLPHFRGRQWVFDDIDKWLQNRNAPRVFPITGLPGTGKSAIAAYLCTKRPDVIAFHICVYGNTLKSDARNCVRSLAYQLSTQLPLYRERLSKVNWENLKSANALTLFDELIVRELGNNTPPPGQNYVILIDALDEASNDGKNELVDFIASHFEHGPDWLRLVVTTRPEPQVLAALSKYEFFVLDKERSENVEDIRAYVKEELSQPPFISDPEALNNAIDIIVARSEGVFLYAYLVCADLQQGHLQLDQAASFPHGLRGVYEQFLKRLYPGGMGFENVRPKLSVIAAGYDWLPKEVVNEIFQLNDATAKAVFDPLRPLFPCVDGRYRPFHKSILDWLSDLDHAGDFYVDVAEGHRKLAEYCWSECKDRVAQNLRLLDGQYQTYAFRHGVRHLIQCNRFADAVDLLDYLFRNSKKFNPDEYAELGQLAKLVTIALGAENAKIPEPEKISASKLAQLIQGLYMSQPLKGGIRLLVKYHPKEWPEILEKFLGSDDYVLRHTIAEVLADDYLETGRPERLKNICDLLEDAELNHQELGAYALQEVYASEPDVIESKYLNRLANGQIYPFRSALGDLLLGLGLQDVGTGEFERLEIMNQVDSSSLFWNPIWNFNGMDVAWLKALNYFARAQALPLDVPQQVAAAHSSLVATEKARQELLQRSDLPKEIFNPLKSYYSLGVTPEKIPEQASIVGQIAGLERIFEVLLAHPLWHITETAASLLASVIDEDPFASHYINRLFEHDHWRVQYGAAEAAFLARFNNKNQLFRQAINLFYQHPEPLLRGDIAENLAAWILDTIPSRRVDLLREFEQPLSYWTGNEDEDAWILDSVYRLFHQLAREGLKAEQTFLVSSKISSLLSGDPVWYTLDRQSFLLRIEERRRNRLTRARSAVIGTAQ